MLKNRFIIVAAAGLAFVLVGAGCGKPTTTTTTSDKPTGVCEKTDYAVTDLVMDQATTTLSDANAVLTTIKRVGDCDAKSFKVTLTDNGTQFFSSEIKMPNESNGLYNDWVAASEGEHVIKAEVFADQDADPSNNVKELKFKVMPIGYLGDGNSKSSQKIGSNNWAAHAFLVGHAVAIKSVWGEFKKISDGELVAQIRKDDGGRPGSVIVEGKTAGVSAVFGTSTPDFKPIGLNMDALLQPGIYWLTFKADGLGAFEWRGADTNVDGPVDDTQTVTVKNGVEPRKTDWVQRNGDLIFYVSALKVGATKADGPIGLANPASVNCVEKGGRSESRERGTLGTYGVCVFDDNRQCDEWAMFRGQCPVGGLKITGYQTEVARFCVISGGEYKITSALEDQNEKGTCTTGQGITCDADEYYTGKCPAPDQVSGTATSSTGMANPASVNCADKGGTLEIRKDKDGGEVGYCKFSSGKECEEWALFRGECRP